ncbi:MAG: hypothetical protein R6V57_01935 [Vicinamibacterales bacterium]
MAGISVAGIAAAGQQQQPPPPPPPPPLPGQAAPSDPRAPQVRRPQYAFEVEIVEGKCQPHQAGQTIKYPDEKGKICPWLMDAMNGAIRVLEHGGTLPWLYAGTPYQKVIDPDGLTTEFIRCPDPTRVVVAKISRRRV